MEDFLNSLRLPKNTFNVGDLRQRFEKSDQTPTSVDASTRVIVSPVSVRYA